MITLYHCPICKNVFTSKNNSICPICDFKGAYFIASKISFFSGFDNIDNEIRQFTANPGTSFP